MQLLQGLGNKLVHLDSSPPKQTAAASAIPCPPDPDPDPELVTPIPLSLPGLDVSMGPQLPGPGGLQQQRPPTPA